MRGFAITGMRLPFGLLALGSFLGVEPGEVIPARVVFSRMLLAEIPALRFVGALGRRTIARFVAACPVAQPDLRRFARTAVSSPARESPVVRSARAAHALAISLQGSA